MIRLATVFSGIGAPEEALRQLNQEHRMIFACDNGERELEVTYEDIMNATEEMTYEERIQYVSNLYADTNKPNLVKESYFANHWITEEQWYDDVRFIDGARYEGQVDVFVGGSPCQSFSTYGKKQGFEDTRGTLFFFYANLIKKIKPKVFIYENVPGLKTHDNGHTWERIQEIFQELEYDIFDFVLNSKDYGLPQHRERVFVVGFSKECNVHEFPEPEHVVLQRTAADYLDQNIPLSYYLGRKGFEWVTTRDKHQGRSRVNRDIIGCQTANQQFNWTGDFRLETPTEEMRHNDNIYIGEYEGEEKVARKLTPAECLRLMGFENFNIVVNDKNAYRQSGNSIAVPVLKALFESILNVVTFE